MLNIKLRVRNLVRKYDTSNPYELARHLKIDVYEFLAVLDFNKDELSRVESGDRYMTEFKKKVESLNNNKRYKEFLSAEEDMRKTNNIFKEIGRREEP